MFNINLITRAAVVIIIVLIGFGITQGLSLTDNDIVNPLRNGAEAERIKADTQWTAKTREIELPFLVEERAVESTVIIAENGQEVKLIEADTDRQIIIRAAEADAEASRIRESARVEKAQNDLNISNQVEWAKTIRDITKSFAIALAVAFSIGLTYALLKVAQIFLARMMPLRQEISTARMQEEESWDNVEFRKQKVHNARQAEKEKREEEIVSNGGNGYHPKSLNGLHARQAK